MIYFVSIIDVSEGGGVPKWDFIHPDTPHPLRERLEKYRELAASFVYGIITAFGGEIVGDRVRELRLSEIQTIFMRLKHKDAMYYVVFIVDIRDNPKAVYRAFIRFYRKYYKEFDEILTSIAVSTSLIERLRTAMAQFLFPYARTSQAFGARDYRHLFSSYLVSLLITGILAMFVWLLNHVYDIKDKNPLLLAGLVFLFIFFLPAMPIGFLTQYKKWGVIVGYLDSLSMVVSATVLWRDMLSSSAASILGKEPESMVLIGAAGLVGIMLGTVLAFMSIIVAGYFEARKLTCIRPLKLIPEAPIVSEEKPKEAEALPSIEEISLQKEEMEGMEIGETVEAPKTAEEPKEGEEIGPSEEAEAPKIDISDIEME